MNKTKSAVTDAGNAPREYFRIEIIETGSALFRSDYSIFNKDTVYAYSLNGIKNALKERYGKAKRQKMYQDPDAKHIGYCYKFRNADYSHAPVEKWNQCDWVQIFNVNEQTIVV